MVEVACENNGKCNIDQRAFKGIFARTLARAALAAPSLVDTDSITRLLGTSAKAAARACTTGNDPKCSLSWSNTTSKWEAGTASEGNLGEVYDALEVVQGLLYPVSKGLRTANGTTSGTGNSTQNGGASGTPSGNPPQQTNSAGSVVSSIIVVFAVALATALSL
jgi:mannan endo-1,6-alpha-mannosidase